MKNCLITPPIFICGFPSSGTDLLKNILNAHPLVYINGEMQFLYHLQHHGYNRDKIFYNKIEVDKFRKYLLKYDVWGNIENLQYEPKKFPINLTQLLRFFFNSTNKKIWGNKTPQNTEHIGDLLQLFPEAKFILIIRDVRDVCLSWRNKWGKNIFNCSRRWNKRMKKGVDEINLLAPQKSLIIKYENILVDFETQTHKITDFLGIEWSENMLSHNKFIGKIKDGKKNYNSNLIKNNFCKWEKEFSKKEIKKIEELSYDAMNLLGYEVSYAQKQKNIGYKIFFFYMYDAFAQIFVGNRYSQNNNFISRIKELMRIIRRK